MARIEQGRPEYRRYMVFGFTYYDAMGGLDDCRVDFDTLDEALDYVREAKLDVIAHDVYEIFDRIAGHIVDVDGGDNGA